MTKIFQLKVALKELALHVILDKPKHENTVNMAWIPCLYVNQAEANLRLKSLPAYNMPIRIKAVIQARRIRLPKKLIQKSVKRH